MDELQIRLIPQFWLPICNSNKKLNKKRKFNVIKPSIVCISERGHLTPLTCSIVRSCSHWWSAFLGEEEKWIGRKWQEMFPTWSEYLYSSQDGNRDIFEGNWFLLIRKRWCFSSDPARLLIGGLLWPWFGRILAAFLIWLCFALAARSLALPFWSVGLWSGQGVAGVGTDRGGRVLLWKSALHILHIFAHLTNFVCKFLHCFVTSYARQHLS